MTYYFNCIQVENVIQEEKTISAYEFIEIYCETVVARLFVIEAQRYLLLITKTVYYLDKYLLLIKTILLFSLSGNVPLTSRGQ